jgi:hypothetical protein
MDQPTLNGRGATVSARCHRRRCVLGNLREPPPVTYGKWRLRVLISLGLFSWRGEIRLHCYLKLTLANMAADRRPRSRLPSQRGAPWAQFLEKTIT